MIKRFILFLLLTIAVNHWCAATVTDGIVTRIQLYETDMLVSVWLSTNTGGVACDNSGSNGAFLSFSMVRPMAKEYLSALLSAQARQATVRVWGKGICIDQANVETLNYFEITN